MVKPRNYKKEYRLYGSSKKSIRYRASLNKYNREHNDPVGNNTDASHKNGHIVGYESEHVNRGRREKSRLRGSKRRKHPR